MGSCQFSAPFSRKRAGYEVKIFWQCIDISSWLLAAIFLASANDMPATHQFNLLNENIFLNLWQKMAFQFLKSLVQYGIEKCHELWMFYWEVKRKDMWPKQMRSQKLEWNDICGRFPLVDWHINVWDVPRKARMVGMGYLWNFHTNSDFWMLAKTWTA